MVGKDTWTQPLPGTSQKPLHKPLVLWFGANPSPALISVAQLGCHGDRARCAKLGESGWYVRRPSRA